MKLWRRSRNSFWGTYIKENTSSRTIIPVRANFSDGFWAATCALLIANHGNLQLPTIHILAFDSIEFVFKKKDKQKNIICVAAVNTIAHCNTGLLNLRRVGYETGRLILIVLIHLSNSSVKVIHPALHRVLCCKCLQLKDFSPF